MNAVPQPLNFLPIKTFLGQQNDCELINLIPFLIWLSKKPDIRPVCDLFNEYSTTFTKKISRESTRAFSQAVSDIEDELITDRRTDQPEMYYPKTGEGHNLNVRKMECVLIKEPTTPKAKNKISLTPKLRESIRKIK